MRHKSHLTSYFTKTKKQRDVICSITVVGFLSKSQKIKRDTNVCHVIIFRRQTRRTQVLINMIYELKRILTIQKNGVIGHFVRDDFDIFKWYNV